ncbi:MAG TPA: hypothetical protein VGP55_16325 [Chitinophagaceae bacterium]|nr:hypothetical protein [Chitinophagaceae bacterium]
MKKIAASIAIFVFTVSMINFDGSRDILKKMHVRYAGKWYKTFSFNHNGSVQ